MVNPAPQLPADDAEDSDSTSLSIVRSRGGDAGPGRFRWKFAYTLTLMSVALIVIVLVGFAVVAGRSATDYFERESQARFAASRDALQNTLRGRFHEAELVRNALTQNRYLRDFISAFHDAHGGAALPGLDAPEPPTSGPGSAEYTFENLAQLIDGYDLFADSNPWPFDGMSIVDQEGRVLFYKTDKDFLNEYPGKTPDASQVPVVKELLSGTGQSWWRVVDAADPAWAGKGVLPDDARGAYLVVAFPLLYEKEVRGAFVFADSLARDGRAMWQYARVSADVKLAVRVGDTFAGAAPDALFAAGLALPLDLTGGHGARVELAGQSWNLQHTRLAQENDLAHVEVLLAENQMTRMNAVNAFRMRLQGAGVFFILLGVALGVFIARQLSAGLKDLSRNVRILRGGRYPDPVVLARRDEVGELAEGFNAMVEGLKTLDRLDSNFRRYQPPEVVDAILANPSVLAPRRQDLTVMFSDIAGFTSISERLPPDQVAELLNLYLAEMVTVARAGGATIDKFIGDAVMVFWGAPTRMADHAARACLTVLRMRAAGARLEQKFVARGWPRVETRFGLNTGDMVVGEFGPSDRVAYTLIGDEVNLASRLEGANKFYGTQIIVGEKTAESARAVAELRELDLVKVKGKEKPVRIFELVAEKGRVPPELRAKHEAYAAALATYRAGSFAEARRAFLAIEGDGPARALAERCEALAAESPQAWDGSFAFDSK